jgi:2-keto-4-pentenoate hydratase/2-oxohepta-3-ene-1,7-dioic acid hydratase in catechol pathway
MRWVRFEVDGKEANGHLDGDDIVEVRGDPFGEWEDTAARHSLQSVKLLVPVQVRTLYAAGLNYAGHVTALANKKGETPKLPAAADIGYRGTNALLPHGGTIVIPRDASERVQYEAELVAVIGRQARDLSEEEALSCVFGYTIGNDISERTWQASDRTLWRAKCSDTFMPMGPWIETDLDLDAAETIVRLNGKETLRFPTNDMIFGVAAFISRMSRYMTLYPGDVVWMGTEGTSENMKHGDTVDVEITGLGVLTNKLARAT